MSRKLFVGSLPFEFSNEQLRELFASAGTVVSAIMVPDPKNNRTRGFGFVDMKTDAEAEAAIAALNGHKIGEKAIWVTIAREKSAADATPERSAPRPLPHAPGYRKPRGFSGGDDRPRRSFDGPRKSFEGPRKSFDGPRKSFGGPRKSFDGPPRKPFDGPRKPFGGFSKPFSNSFDRPGEGRPAGPRGPRRSFDGPKSFGGPRRPFSGGKSGQRRAGPPGPRKSGPPRQRRPSV